MAAPNTGGVLKTKIVDMKIGDFAICRLGNISATSTNIIYEFGTTTVSEIPVTGSASLSGAFYLIKVDKGLLVADRVVRHSISWDTLNSYDLVEGKPNTLDGITGVLRSLGGGNSYATATGTSSTTDSGNGAWPTTNEWDEYIVRKDYGGAGPGADSIWHWTSCRTWKQDTPQLNLFGDSSSSTRMISQQTGVKNIGRIASLAVTDNIGFRPVFEFQE